MQSVSIRAIRVSCCFFLRSKFLDRDRRLLAALVLTPVLLAAVGAAVDTSFVWISLSAAFCSAADRAFASAVFASIDFHILLRFCSAREMQELCRKGSWAL